MRYITLKESEEYLTERYKRQPTEQEIEDYYNYMNNCN